jgi:tRNA pseudouridine38-40 synthase
VGEGRWNADDVSRALYARSRSACAPVAPAEGLYLVKVDYDAEAEFDAVLTEDNSC